MLGGNGPISDVKNSGSLSSVGQSAELKKGGWKPEGLQMRARPDAPAPILKSLQSAGALGKSKARSKAESKDDPSKT
jgi:hypothetical protein